MQIRKLCRWTGALGMVGLLFAGIARADFRAAMTAFNAGNYEAARSEFLALAALGDGRSQFNLAAMSIHGQGTPKDQAAALGWLLAAEENGYPGPSPEKLNAMKAGLTDDQREEAQRILDTYGHQTLLRTVLPPDEKILQCPGFTQARPEVMEAPHVDILSRLPPGIALVEFAVGVDGFIRDPRVRLAISSDPKLDLGAREIEGLFQWRWRPASLNGRPVEARITLKVLSGGIKAQGYSPWHLEQVSKIRTAAEQGDPDAEYLFGELVLVDPKLGHGVEFRDFLVSAAQQGHAKAAYEVAQSFQWLGLCQKDDHRLPWLRYAANAGEPIAQLATAEEALRRPASADPQKVVQLLQHAVTSDDFYVKKHAVALLAASPLETIRKPDVALVGARALLDGPIQSDPQMFEAVAAAYAVTGDFADAQSQEAIALKKAKKLGWHTDPMEERLAAYRSGKPWYGDLLDYRAASAR